MSEIRILPKSGHEQVRFSNGLDFGTLRLSLNGSDFERSVYDRTFKNRTKTKQSRSKPNKKPVPNWFGVVFEKTKYLRTNGTKRSKNKTGLLFKI